MYSKSIIPLCILFFIAFSFKNNAQEQLGLCLDNYAGVNALTLNPAASATNPLKWDINIVGVGAWFNTNLGYIQKASVPKLLNNLYSTGPHPDLNMAYKGTPSLYFNINERNNYSFSLGGRILGPSVALNLKNGHSFGLFTGARFMITSHDVTKLASPVEFNKIKYNQAFKIDPFKVAGMSWTELGLNYAYQFDTDTEGGLTVGANVKYLQGFQSFFLNNYNGTTASRANKDTFRIDAIRATAGFTTSYDTNLFQQNGGGIGFDIGVVIKTDGGNDRPYGWRLGVSLIDLGNITISGAAEVHSFHSKEAFQLQARDFDSLNVANGSGTNPRAAALAKVDEKISTAQNNTNLGNSFVVGMPSAIQLQADYAFTNNLFVNGLLIQRFRINEVALERENILALTPRYESRWLGASMPISITNMQNLQVGLNARLAFLSIGTERLFSWLGTSKLSGTDFYVALKLNPFQLNLFNKGGSGGKKPSCYRF
jgi:hypothetical protein